MPSQSQPRILFPLIFTNSGHVMLIEQKLHGLISSTSLYLEKFLQFRFENFSNEKSLDFVNINAL